MKRTKKRTVIVNKRRFFTALTLAIVLVNILFVYAYLPENTQADTVEKTQTITVCAGDTLWSIAQEHGAEDSDVRDTVYQIKQLNDLKCGDLVVGQSLIVPLF